MGAVGWIWAWLMLLGGVRAHLAQSLPAELVGAMIVSGLFALPLLWDPGNGLFGRYAPSGVVRGGIALLALVVVGISRPDAVMGLIGA
jgi:hypothetical protein